MNGLLVSLSILLFIQLSLRRIVGKQKQSDVQLTPEKCTIPHVPPHLHWDGITVVEIFSHNEKLFWRIQKTNNIDNPFLSIKLVDISVNRSGSEDVFFCNAIDTLINITNPSETHYTNCDVLELSIEKQNLNKETIKKFSSPSEIAEGETQYSVELHLIHDPMPCNKAHSMFRFKFDGEFVKWDDYKNSFGKDTPKALKRLRQICKDELYKMIVRRIVCFD